MNAPRTVTELLDRMEQARADWDDLVEQVSPAWMLLPVTGVWTLKDLIAHLTWFEREMLALLRARALAGSELWELPPEERNAAIYRQNRDRPLEDVLAASTQVYQDLIRAVDALEDADLRDPSRFANLPAGWRIGQVLAENTYAHYQAHLPDVRAWLERG